MTLIEQPTPRAINAHEAVIPRHGALAISLILLAFAVALILMGCGLTINSTAGSGPSQGSGSAGGSGSSGDGGPAGGSAIPVPGALQALTGCANPNTGVASGDWGVGNDPVYTTVDNTAPVVGAPIYTSNAVFWTSRENAPGQ